MEPTRSITMTPRNTRINAAAPTRRWPRPLTPIVGLGLTLAVFAPVAPSQADSAQAYCVLSWAKRGQPLEEGPCQWSQRQGNANILFKNQRFDFPAAEEGKTFTRTNRPGNEAGPVFSRQGKFTLSVYWRQPAKEKGGW
jgi:hypothetical protein